MRYAAHRIPCKQRKSNAGNWTGYIRVYLIPAVTALLLRKLPANTPIWIRLFSESVLLSLEFVNPAGHLRPVDATCPECKQSIWGRENRRHRSDAICPDGGAYGWLSDKTISSLLDYWLRECGFGVVVFCHGQALVFNTAGRIWWTHASVSSCRWRNYFESSLSVRWGFIGQSISKRCILFIDSVAWRSRFIGVRIYMQGRHFTYYQPLKFANLSLSETPIICSSLPYRRPMQQKSRVSVPFAVLPLTVITTPSELISIYYTRPRGHEPKQTCLSETTIASLALGSFSLCIHFQLNSQILNVLSRSPSPKDPGQVFGLPSSVGTTLEG